jgi:DNA-directed RNA polymerase beta subunit
VISKIVDEHDMPFEDGTVDVILNPLGVRAAERSD